MGGNKIASIADGSAASDAAAFGQVPAGGATVTVTQGGTGSATQQPGQSPFFPAVMAPVKWAFFNTDVSGAGIGNYTYYNGPNDDGVDATITGAANGAISFFYEPGNTPAAGDRLVVIDPYSHGTGNPPHPDGIYTITALGDASSPYVLTRAADMNSAATIGRYWAVQVTDGAVMGGGWASVLALSDVDTSEPQAFVPGTSFLGFALAAPSCWVSAPWSTATGNSAVAVGAQATADGNNSFAVGNTAWASGDTATGLGSYSYARGQNSTSVGNGTYANAISATAVGSNSNAYAPGMTTVAGAWNNNPGDAQSTSTVFSGTTTDATATALTLPFSNPWIFETWNGSGHTDWAKTLLVKATAVARRADTPGTDSAWTAQGVLRGDGSAAYTWIGGSAPAFTVVAQDSAASSWSVVAAVDNTKPGITVTVTGAASETIDWAVIVETYEVSSSSA